MILGSFPSRISREFAFYYMNPQNRFYAMLAGSFDEDVPASLSSKKDFLKRHRIALFDSYSSLSIEGSGDSSIKEARTSDLNPILSNSVIKLILCNGKAAYKGALEQKDLGIPIIPLPSTSSANASFSLSKLIEAYKPYLVGQK